MIFINKSRQILKKLLIIHRLILVWISLVQLGLMFDSLFLAAILKSTDKLETYSSLNGHNFASLTI